jgi:hypothetical protein
MNDDKEWRPRLDAWLDEKKPLIELEESEKLYVGPETKDRLMALLDQLAIARGNRQELQVTELLLQVHDTVIHGFCSGIKAVCYCSPCSRGRMLR